MGRKTIGKRLMITNFIILFMCLIAFFTFGLAVFRNQSLTQEKKHLTNENYTFSQRLTDVELKIFPMGASMSGARYFHIWYYKNEHKTSEDFKNRVNILQRENTSRDFISDLMLESKLENLTEKPQKIVLNEQEYLAVSSSSVNTISLMKEKEVEIILVTLVPYEEIIGFDTKMIVHFAMLLVTLATVSGFLMYVQSKNITKPIKKLMQTSKEYANRDFTNSIILNTDDEIEDLSKSIEKMVTRLQEYEKSQINLFRNLSHELKTPLTAISGYAEGIELGRFEDTKEPLKIIQEESKRIKNILEDLIFLSKNGSDSEEYSMNDENIVDIIIKSLEKIESIAIINDVDLEFIPSKEILVNCDKDKITRAFINILSNSLKYGKDLITVKIEDDFDEINVIFKDNGNGFEMNILDKVLEKELKTTIDGNGLGLMIVKEIVNKHNGTVEFRNDDGAIIKIKLKKARLI